MSTSSTRTSRKHSRPADRDDFEIAIVCALPLEYDAVCLAYDELWDDQGDHYGRSHGDHNTYTTGRIGNHAVVLVCAPGMGKANSAGLAASLRHSYPRIALTLLVGICGGVPRVGTEREILLGDVAISKQVIQVDLGRQYPGMFVPKDSGWESLSRPNNNIRALLARLESHHGLEQVERGTSQFLSEIQQNAEKRGWPKAYDYPGPEQDRLFPTTYVHKHHGQAGCGCIGESPCETAMTASCEELCCDVKLLLQRRRLSGRQQHGSTAPDRKVFIGNVASSDAVMKSGQHRDQLADKYNLIAFEMEGAGLWEELPCVVVKGVCDYADSHKDKKWQHHAAAVAAAAAKTVLRYYAQTEASIKAERAPRHQRYFIVPYSRNPDFVGRTSIIKQIRKKFGHGYSNTRPRSRVSIYGLGGVGKSQIALEYAYLAYETYSDISIFWVHGGTAELFRREFSFIAQQCGIPGREDPKADVVSLVTTWLRSREQGRWLLVIDNADDFSLFCGEPEPQPSNKRATGTTSLDTGLERYLPDRSNGCILITTRNKQVGQRLAQGNGLFQISKMDNSEVNQLLRKLLGDEDHDLTIEETTKLAGRLENLPLALAQAAAYIQANDISVDAYTELLDQSDSSLVARLSEPFRTVGRNLEAPHAVAATWLISFQQIAQQNRLASELLSLFSFFDRQTIPRDYVSHYVAESPFDTERSGTEATQIIEAIGLLKSFSFVTEAKDKSLDLHRLVHIITRKWVEDQGTDKLEVVAGCALKVVRDAFPRGVFENGAECRRQLPHAKAVLQQQQHLQGRPEKTDVDEVLLRHNMGIFCVVEGQYKDAQRYFESAAELNARVRGRDHPDTFTSLGSLALTYMSQGRLTKAEELLRQVLEAQEQMQGHEHLETLITMNHIASSIQGQGRYAEAEKLHEHVSAIRKRIQGGEHPDTLASTNNLATSIAAQSRHAEAEDLHKQVFEIRKRVQGDEHPDTLASMNNLANSIRSQGRYAEAENLQKQTFEIRKRVQGDEHPDTLKSVHNLANSIVGQGRYMEAEQLYKQALEVGERVLGAEHPSALNSLSSLANSIARQGRYAEAEELHKQAFEARKRVLGEEHPMTLNSLLNLALNLHLQGHLNDAIALLAKYSLLLCKVFGNSHPRAIKSCRMLEEWQKTKAEEWGGRSNDSDNGVSLDDEDALSS